MKVIHTCESFAEAAVLRIALRDRGIESILDNARSAGFVGLPAAPLGIIVSDEDAPKAAKIVAAVLGRLRKKRAPKKAKAASRRRARAKPSKPRRRPR